MRYFAADTPSPAPQSSIMETLTPLSKLLIAGILAGSSVTAFRTYGTQPLTSLAEPLAPAQTAAAGSAPRGLATATPAVSANAAGRPLRLALSQWPGHMPLLLATGGLRTEAGSPAAKLGLDLELVFIEDAPTKNKALQTGEVDFVWQTVDELPISMGDYKAAGVEPKTFLQVDWSRGGDACVATQAVQKVEDLVGRKAATLLFSPDHTLFEFMISNSRLTPQEVGHVRKQAQFSPDDLSFAGKLFAAGKVDVACLWEPDVTLALASRPGAHRLFSTADATELIADVLLTKKQLLEQHPDLAEKLALAWFEGVALAERDRPGAARLIARVAPRFRDELGYEKTLAALSWTKWSDLPDNARFFGLDGAAAAFDRVYNQADGIWTNYPEAKLHDRYAPAVLRDDRIVKKIWEAKGKPAPHVMAPPATELAKKGAAVFTKPLSIGFATGSRRLTYEAIAVINREVLNQMQMAGGMSVRVEGNTDNVGDPADNQTLSEERAQAIVDYLVSRGIPTSRMIARGNGASNPVAANATPEGRAQNRRTDLLFIRNPRP